MSYDSSTMRLMGGVPGQQLFLYKTTDKYTVVDDSGYFDTAVTDYHLSTGDIVNVVYDTGGTVGTKRYVCTVTNGTVTTTLGT